MGVTGNSGLFGFGPQSAKDTAPATWYRHRATVVDLGIADAVREGAPEVGGIAVPTFPYKTGPFAGGGFTLQPRLQDTFGWLLYAAMGSHSVTESPASSGLYNHTFTLKAADSTFLPWIAFRKSVPRVDGGAATDLGQVFTNSKILSCVFQMTNTDPIAARFEALATKPTLDHDPTAWTWGNTLEDWQSIPVSCIVGGHIKIGSDELPVMAATVGIQNVPLDIRQERIYGDPYLQGITIMQRRLVFDLTVLWHNPNLYAQVYGGTTTATAWSHHPYTAAFEVKALSSQNMPSETEPYALTVSAANVMMQQVGDITLAGNQSVMLRFQGTALDDGSTYASIVLRNKVADYAWPT